MQQHTVHPLFCSFAVLLQGLSKWASAELPRYLRPAEQQWQPADLLPNPASPTYPQQVRWLPLTEGREPRRENSLRAENIKTLKGETCCPTLLLDVSFIGTRGLTTAGAST